MNRHPSAPASRARLTALGSVFAVDSSEGRPLHDALMDLLTRNDLPARTRSCIAMLTVTGRYPTRDERDQLAALLSDAEPTRIRMHLDAAARSTPRRIRHSRCVIVTGQVIDVTRTAESISLTGVPRVVRALARRGQAVGATLVTWRSGCPVVFEQSLYGEQDRAQGASADATNRLTIKARVRLVGWRISRFLSRIPGAVPAATHISERLQHASMTGGLRRTSIVILGPGQYLLAETPDAITCERLAVWREALPAFAVTPFVHDSLPMSHPQYFPRQMVDDFTAFLDLALNSPAAITSTRAVAGELCTQAVSRGRGATPSVEVLGFGSDAAAWSPVVIPPHEVPVFLTVGGFDDRKNVATLLRALIDLAQAGDVFGVRIVAQSMAMTSTTRSLISRARAAGVEVEIHCRIKDSLMAAFIDQASASIYLSSAEGYGLPIVESLVRGTPVIASDIPSTRELAGYGGVQLISLDDRQALAVALRTIARDPAHRARLCQAIDHAAIPPGLDAWADALLGRASN